MKPKLFLMIAGAFFLIEGLTGFFMVEGFDFMAWGFSIFCLSLGVLFLLTRNESPSSARNAIFWTGLIASLGISVIGYYAQWSGKFLDSPVGYLPPTLWLLVAIGFFLVGRANMTAPSSQAR